MLSSKFSPFKKCSPESTRPSKSAHLKVIPCVLCYIKHLTRNSLVIRCVGETPVCNVAVRKFEKVMCSISPRQLREMLSYLCHLINTKWLSAPWRYSLKIFRKNSMYLWTEFNDLWRFINIITSNRPLTIPNDTVWQHVWKTRQEVHQSNLVKHYWE